MMIILRFFLDGIAVNHLLFCAKCILWYTEIYYSCIFFCPTWKININFEICIRNCTVSPASDCEFTLNKYFNQVVMKYKGKSTGRVIDYRIETINTEWIFSGNYHILFFEKKILFFCMRNKVPYVVFVKNGQKTQHHSTLPFTQKPGHLEYLKLEKHTYIKLKLP